MEESILKPCPFCGGEANLCVSRYGYWVECENPVCYLMPSTVFFDSREEATNVWNRRAKDE